MKVKKVNRYYCDFCKKANCSSVSISRHEKHCTMNPKRECRMCKILKNKTVPMKKLLQITPTTNATKELLEPLRGLVDNCPACILAALRQSGCTDYTLFDYKKEVEAFWAEVNEQQRMEDEAAILYEVSR